LRAARRKVMSAAGPTSRMHTKLVSARPVSQPSEVVASKSRYRCHCSTNDAPGRYARELVRSTANGQNDRLSMKPKK
jgi:hypothetical protein